MSFRMTVEDVFAIRNRGVVATGRVESGVLRVGDVLRIDGGPEVRVDGIERFRKTLDEATVDDNIGVLFTGIDKSQIDRGAVLSGGEGSATTFIV
jgi:elongation factor Tu